MARRRELLEGVGIDLVLEVEAALQLATLSGEFLRVGHYLLCLGGTGGDALEGGEPCGAAEFAAAGAYATHLAGLLAYADLFHLYTHPELLGEYLDEFAEVHTCVGGVVEDGLRAVALVLHVVDFHVQPHVRHYLACAYEGAVLLAHGDVPSLYVGLLGTAEELAHVLRVGAYPVLAHLQAAELAGEAHYAHIVSGLSLDGHYVALGHLQPVRQAVEVLVVVLEAHLDAVEGAHGRLPYAGKPVGGGYLRAALALALAHGLVALGAVVAAAAEVEGLLVLHPRYLGVRLQIGVQGALLRVVFLHLGVLALYGALLGLTGFAPFAHKSLYIFSTGHLFHVVGNGCGGLVLQLFLFVLFHRLVIFSSTPCSY